MTTARNDAAWCPFCYGDKCEHFAGWTEDGRWIIGPTETHHPERNKQPILETDRIVKPGVSARVYRRKP